MLLTDKSKFVKANVNVRDQDVLMFTNEGEEGPTKYGSVKLSIGVRTSTGDEKVISLNAQSERNMKEAYGPDTKGWIGKEARVHIREENVGNEFKDVIYLTRPDKNLKGEIVFQ